MKSVFQKNQILIFYLFISLLSGSFVRAQNDSRVNGTTGTPLGGFGAGAVKFNANNGTFAIMTRPPADAYDFKVVRNAKFQLFCKRGNTVKNVDVLKAKMVNARPEDDAIWPVHKANLGTLDNIQVDLTGFSPLDNIQYDNMSLPYAFYEATLTNTSGQEATAAIALQWDAGSESFSYVKNKGISCASRTIFASSNDIKAQITAGDDIDPYFLKEGKCQNKVSGSVAKVAVSVRLKANESKKIRFVIAWYENSDPELAYYLNLCKDSKGVAQQGLSVFDKLKSNAEKLETKFRASNLPDWLKNQTLNTLVNLTVNSMYKKDGRVSFAEGQWTCFGTMDQMWHARQIVGQLIPFYAWQELRYWARTQMKNGQIHHDFNQMGGESTKEKRSVLVGWDDTEHTDYRNVLKWVDLNCALITSTYETYQMTGDRKQFDFLWPYLKKAGQRILDQVEQYGSKEYPYTFDHSENSYDAGGDPNPFNANFSAVAYKVMTILAKEKGETALVEKYQKAYDTVVKSFAARYLNDKNFKLSKHCESFYGGQWLAFNMKLGEIWRADQTDFVLKKLDEYYHPYYWGLGNEKGSYDEWTPYILTHYGGLLLNTNRANQWEVMQKDAYNRQYMNRDKVFDHPLNILPVVKEPKWIATNISGDKQYISMPALWRNYYDIVGYYRDLRTRELWIKPVLPEEVNHKMTDAMFVSPEGYGTISCTESGQYFQNKEIVFKTDNPVSVSTLYLTDNFGETVTVSIDGKKYPFERTGSGYAKELAVKWNGKVDERGIRIVVQGDPGKSMPALPAKPEPDTRGQSLASVVLNPYNGLEAENATKSAGVKMEISKQGEGYVSSCNNFDYIQFSNVDFGQSGAKRFSARIASVVGNASIEIVLDNVAGELIGTCPVIKTGSFQNWASVSSPITKTKGVHDVILRFSGAASDDLMTLDQINFFEN